MKRCEQPVPLSPFSLSLSRPSSPSPSPLFSLQPASREAHRAARPNDRTANIWQLRNMSLHLIIAVNTGGRVEWPQGVSPTRYGRRPRAPAWDKFRFTPPLPPFRSLRLSPSRSERDTLLLQTTCVAASY